MASNQKDPIAQVIKELTKRKKLNLRSKKDRRFIFKLLRVAEKKIFLAGHNEGLGGERHSTIAYREYRKRIDGTKLFEAGTE